MFDLAAIYPEFDEIIESMQLELQGASPSLFGEICERLSLVCRSAAIASLLIELDLNRFRGLLEQSGSTRAFLLTSLGADEKEASRFCKLSRLNGIVDSIVAGRRDLVQEIARASACGINKRFEYEEDYHYARVFHSLALDEVEEVQREALRLFEAQHEVASSPKLQLCRVVVEHDVDGFDGAFESLLEARSAEIEAMRVSLSRDELEFSTARHVYLEGLAWLRIASSRGVPLRQEYAYCPRDVLASW